MATALSSSEVQVGLYVRPKRAHRTFYEVEERNVMQGTLSRVLLRDVRIPCDECVGDHGTIETDVQRILREYEPVMPALEDLAA